MKNYSGNQKDKSIIVTEFTDRSPVITNSSQNPVNFLGNQKVKSIKVTEVIVRSSFIIYFPVKILGIF